MQWVIAATLLCGTTTLMTSCKTTKSASDGAAQVVKEELIRTSQSWDGVELPDYLQGRPELVAVKYVFPAGQKLGWHQAVVEMVNTIHHGQNRGKKPVILYMFYLAKEGMPLAVQHPEIPLE